MRWTPESKKTSGRALAPIFILAFLFGVSVRSFFDFGDSFIVLLFLFALVFLALYFSSVRLSLRSAPFLFAFVFILGCVFGIFRMGQDERVSLLLEPFVGSEEAFRGVVRSEPDRRETNTRYVVELEKDGTRGKALLYADPLALFSYGNCVEVKGTLSIPKNFYSENAFDWYSYLARKDIFYDMRYPDIHPCADASVEAFSLRRNLFLLKRSFVENIKSVVSEPGATLLAGQVVGEKSGMDKNLEELLRKVGVIHIVVLSGYNITIVAEAVMRTLSALAVSAGTATLTSIIGIALFAVMTGANPPIVRAALMAALVILAKRYGQVYDINTALLSSLFLMVLWDPSTLIFDYSLELSFLATLGLIYLAPAFEKKLSFLPERFQLRSIAGATLATQVFVLPLLIYMTGEISLVSLPANILILPTVPFVMFFGFLSGALGFISYHLSLFAGVLASLLLQYQIFIIELLGALPFASVWF